jgi:uncharacterized flavoprotein (TIGR03862 family)
VQKHALVIGGGPAGLMAAEVFATAGLRVTLVDRMRTPGRKFILAGRGGLNLTHSEERNAFLSRYEPKNSILENAIDAFPPSAFRAWVAGLGENTFVGTSGRIFPVSLGATPLLRAWLDRLQRLGVEFKTEHRWTGWVPRSGTGQPGHGERGHGERGHGEHGHSFTHVRTNDEILISPDVAVIALGGASWPRTGSDGLWVSAIESQGVSVSKLQASNCGYLVAWSQHFALRHAGKPLKNVSITVDSITRRGEVMLTQSGIEGGLIYSFGQELRGLFAKSIPSAVSISIDLRADVTLRALTLSLSKLRGSQSTSTWLSKRAHLSPQGIGLLREFGNQIEGAPDEIAAQIKGVKIPLVGPTLIDRAISTAGGIDLEQLNDSFMLKPSPGLFVAGEMLGWDAPTGGYLLQACVSTGYAAAHGALQWLDANPHLP